MIRRSGKLLLSLIGVLGGGGRRTCSPKPKVPNKKSGEGEKEKESDTNSDTGKNPGAGVIVVVVIVARGNEGRGRRRWGRRGGEVNPGGLGGEGNEERGKRENEIVGGELVSVVDRLGVGETKRGGDGRNGVAPGDEIGEKVPDAGGSLVGSRASATEGDRDVDTEGEVAVVVGVVIGEGLASGEALVSVVGEGEVSIVHVVEYERGIVLIIVLLLLL